MPMLCATGACTEDTTAPADGCAEAPELHGCVWNGEALASSAATTATASCRHASPLAAASAVRQSQSMPAPLAVETKIFAPSVVVLNLPSIFRSSATSAM